MLSLLALSSCKKLPKQEAGVVLPPPREALRIPTGKIADGQYQDQRYPFQIAIPPGWSAETGINNQSLRVRMRHADTDTVVEVHAYPGTFSSPRPRDGCVWTFEDAGPYTAPGLTEPLLVSTCTPSDIAEPRVFGHLLPQETHTWQLELHVPIDRLSPGIRAGNSVLQTVRLR
ncbi:MAG: hypothetical protein AAFV53_09795 [Myxococcota bacterium]